MPKKKTKVAGKKEPKPFFRKFTKTWYLQLGQRQIKLGKSRDEAWARYHELMNDREEVEATTDTTVVDVLNAFCDWVKDWRSPGTYQWYSGHLRKFSDHIGALKLLDLKEKHLTAWIDKNFKQAAPDTIYGAIRTVQRAMNWAVKRGYLPKSPVKDKEKPSQQPRDVVIEPDQFEQILGRCRDQQARDLFTVLWETGCRVQEIRKVEAHHFHEDERRWLFPRSQAKGKRTPRVVYLTDEALEISLRLAAKHPHGPLFRNARGKPWTKNAIIMRFNKLVRAPKRKCAYCSGEAVAFLRGAYVPEKDKQGRKRKYVCKDCIRRKKLTKEMLGKIKQPIPGLEKACSTTLRHSFITRALKNHVAGITVAVLVGHSDTQMISRVYSHLEKDPDFLRGQLQQATSMPKPR